MSENKTVQSGTNKTFIGKIYLVVYFKTSKFLFNPDRLLLLYFQPKLVSNCSNVFNLTNNLKSGLM